MNIIITVHVGNTQKAGNKNMSMQHLTEENRSEGYFMESCHSVILSPANTCMLVHV